MSAPRCHVLHRAGNWSVAQAAIALDYESRLLRRKRLQTGCGQVFFVDLAETVNVNEGDAFELTDGRLVAVRAAPEPLHAVRGDNLARLAWHIGNRHTPCQIGSGQLLIRRDPVLADMLRRLGAELRDINAPFTPEGGAYGHGRTMGHDHHAHDH
ncbi:MAG: urease accessory protein UreE [Pararhodobacter sp.]|nr:urease accessory protein UreE [Pararhodobacter sp.]